MQVSLLRESLTSFAGALAGGWSSGLEPVYGAIASWQSNWPPASPEGLPAALEASLQSARSRALWQGHAYAPKEVVVELARFAPEMMNLAFGRLFAADDVGLDDRLRQFNFYLDEVAAEWRRAHPARTLSTHYHDDYRAPSLYAACRHPATHAYFEGEHYLAALRVLRARDVGAVAEPARFAKSVKVVMTFAAKTEGLAAADLSRRRDDEYRATAATLASEYFRFLAGAGG